MWSIRTVLHLVHSSCIAASSSIVFCIPANSSSARLWVHPASSRLESRIRSLEGDRLLLRGTSSVCPWLHLLVHLCFSFETSELSLGLLRFFLDHLLYPWIIYFFFKWDGFVLWISNFFFKRDGFVLWISNFFFKRDGFVFRIVYFFFERDDFVLRIIDFFFKRDVFSVPSQS